MATMRRLTVEDLPDIARVETQSFVAGARVDATQLRRRLELDHIMLGIYENDELVGMIVFLLAKFDSSNQASCLRSQVELSSQLNQPGANAGFIYNLAIVPEHRRLRRARQLYRAATASIAAAGCDYVVGAVRVPSYRGSQAGPQENIPHSPRLAGAIDRFLAGGDFPSPEDFCCDPLLAFHQRMSGGKFLWILPEFEPHDEASGRMYVVQYARAAEMLCRLENRR